MDSENDKALFKRMFCYYFLKFRNIKEAGIRSGFSENEAFFEGMKILASNGTQRQLEKIKQKADFSSGLVKAGLERLAFGNINDAVKLAFSDEGMSEKELASLDLFNVSEIKRVKGGGVEIKLFDRQKALELLWEMENTADISSSAESFFNAVKVGAEAIDNKGSGED